MVEEQEWDKGEAFAVQEKVRVEIPHLMEKKLLSPTTVMIPEVEWLRRFSPSHILGQTHMSSEDEEEQKRIKDTLLISENEVIKWGIRNGDKLTLEFDSKTKKVKITAVNGESDPKKVISRPHIIGVDEIKPTYARRRLPIEKFGIDWPANPKIMKGEVSATKDITLIAFSLRAPPGKGQRLFVISPPEAGKTWVIRSFWEACLKLTRTDEKLYIVGLHVGERAEDGYVLELIMNNTLYDTERVELYQTPDGDPEDAHYYVTEYVVERARRLCESGYDVVLMVDSFSRVLMSHSRSEKITKPAGSGMISGGIKEASIAAVKRLLSVAGDFGDRSLTIVATMLTDDKNVRRKSSESSLFDETGPSTSTAIWSLVNIPFLTDRYRPWIDVVRTRARQYQSICTSGQLEDMREVQKIMWSEVEEKNGVKRRARAEDALTRLLDYARSYKVR